MFAAGFSVGPAIEPGEAYEAYTLDDESNLNPLTTVAALVPANFPPARGRDNPPPASRRFRRVA
jgi:hypothetical protein